MHTFLQIMILHELPSFNYLCNMKREDEDDNDNDELIPFYEN